PLPATSDAADADADERDADAMTAAAEPTSAGEGEEPPGTAAAQPAPATDGAATPGVADPWAPLLAAGAQLLGELAAASQGERQSTLVHTDPATGQRYLRLPVPDPQTVHNLAAGLLALFGKPK
ncbi:MAG: ATP-dependent helicase, partial [Candidatus Accumulibacter sp.]|nr:ATP-dependent helicase [Accumulibacter sp.]